MNYLVTVKANHESDIQPTIAAFASEDVTEVYGVDTDKVRVTLRENADAAAFEAAMEADENVSRWGGGEVTYE